MEQDKSRAGAGQAYLSNANAKVDQLGLRIEVGVGVGVGVATQGTHNGIQSEVCNSDLPRADSPHATLPSPLLLLLLVACAFFDRVE